MGLTAARAALTAVVLTGAAPMAVAPTVAVRMTAAAPKMAVGPTRAVARRTGAAPAPLHSYNRYTRLNNHYYIPEAQSSHTRCRIKNRYVCLLGNHKSCHWLLDH